ncbi:hypothetical protein JW865_05550 [Candidatus Bathyarchaeota archaeon]|nr:hypothetical protein [Candidatus Bathyarchaeota archaeon]
MTNHKLAKYLEGFDTYSYYLGINAGFAEVVGAGCKKLALSSPLTQSELDILLKPTEIVAQEYNVKIFVEKDFLTTKLFPPELTEGKSVIFLAADDLVLEEYHNLKNMKEKSIKENNLLNVEEEIAWKFGKLLSYSPEKIRSLIIKNS